MKHLFALILSLFMLVETQAQQQLLSPRITTKTDNIDISYGQPSKRGRDIFGDLVPYGEVWRTGANEATEITIKKNCTFGGKKLKAGTYTLFTIPGEKEWVIILNSKLGEWGAFDYDKHKASNVLETKVTAVSTNTEVEKLTITPAADELVLEWDKVKVRVPITY